ncbi:hypothetical protein HH308_21720 [Gordonia sp. TBRC 11910]|uniref:Uncharacterized protein n=1 Tax=Gordonia asplenii TaxID=2725283 RepID=A0A848L077_9ACTN|nr:hypothetical protein [Gordonia asplenii]NMO03837.1 hypothetical protein [Gordonia asplenii]
MGHHKENDELREDRNEQAEEREERRDEGGADNIGSQDRRRQEGQR